MQVSNEVFNKYESKCQGNSSIAAAQVITAIASLLFLATTPKTTQSQYVWLN